MNPVNFSEVNKCLTKPDNMTDEECPSLYVYADDNMCISKWMPTDEEQVLIAKGYGVYVIVHTPQSQPPIAISAITPFKDGL